MDRPAPRTAGLGSKRRRTCQACSECRMRKIRCDLPSRHPCSSCAAASRSCTATSHVTTSAHAEMPLTMAHNDAMVTERSSTTVQMNVRPPVAASSIHFNRPATILGQQALQASLSGGQPDAASPSEATSASLRSARPPMVTGDEYVWARMIENSDHAESFLREESLSLVSPSSRQKDQPLHKCVRFQGEAMAHSMLPHMEGHTELSVDPLAQRPSGMDRTYLHRFNAPRAHRPQGKGPWFNASCDAHFDLLSHLPKEDQFYLYSIKKVLSFPQRSVAEKLLVIFFESCYPLMPVFDRNAVLHLYEAMYTNRRSSPLVFHAILFTACHFADPPLLLEAGFHSVLEAKVYFFRCAKVLYMHDCEPDHVSVVQALILMTFWWMDYTEEKDMRFWVSCAVNLALTMGMNKVGVNTIGMAPTEEAVWRRIFWTLFSRDHTIAVALGLPFLLNLKDCDLKPLSEADFRDCDQTAVVPGVLSRAVFLTQGDYYVYATVRLVELTIRVEEMLLAAQGAVDSSQSLAALDGMKDIVSREKFSTSGMMEDNFSVEDARTWNRSNVFAIFLFLYHERIVILYYRRYERALVALQKADIDRRTDGDRERNSLDTALDRQWTKRENDLAQIRASILQSADNIIEMLDKLLAQDLLRYAPSHVNTSCFHALLGIAEEIVTTSPSTAEPQSAKQKYSKGLQAVEHMKNYWNMASWAHSMFKKLADDDFRALKVSADQRRREQGRSRIPSRIHSPGPELDDLNFRTGLDLFGTGLNSDQDLEINFDPLSDWENMNSLEGWSSLWEYDRGGGC